MPNQPFLLDQKINIPEQYDPNAKYILYRGDTNNFVESIPDHSLRLVITSPPYNLGKEYETRTNLKLYLESQKDLISKMVNKVALNGSICWQVGNYVEEGEVFPLDIYYYEIFKDLGLKLRNRIIWHFGHGLHAKKRFSGRYETLLWFTLTDDYIFNLDPVRVPQKYPGKRHFKGKKKGEYSGNPKGKNPSDYWEMICQEWDEGIIDIPNVKSNHPEKTIHPCQFPIELVERCVLALTNEDDSVFDPFAGTGSSIVGAIKHNRRGLGAEKEPEYVDIARDRINQYLNGTIRVRKLGTKIHKPSGAEKVTKRPVEWEQINANT